MADFNNNVDDIEKNFEKYIRGKNLNFLIGSGMSASLYGTLKFCDKCNWSFEDVLNHKDIKNDDLKRIWIYVYYYYKTIQPMFNEHDQVDECKKDCFNDYYLFINWCYMYLITEGSERPRRINIFTTNYDLLFEQTFDKFLVDYPLIMFNDGSKGCFQRYIDCKNYDITASYNGTNDNLKNSIPVINLYKLHGSISWLLDENKRIKVDANCNKEANESIDNALWLFTSEQTQQIANWKCKSAKHDFNEFIEQLSTFDKYENLLIGFYEQYQKLQIINPTDNKFSETTMDKYFFDQLRSLTNELQKKQSVLITFGFSFKDIHIKDIVKRCIIDNPELSVFIISYSKGTQDELKEEFRAYRQVKFLPNFDSSIPLKGDTKYFLKLLRSIGD